MSAGMAAGVEIAETATRLTGNSTLFCASVTGQYGGVAWATGLADLDAAERAGETLASSPEWLPLVDRVGPSFGPGVAVTLWRSIG